MKSPEEEVLPAGKKFAHIRVLRGNLAKSLTIGRPFLGGQWSKFWGGGGPKHTLAHQLKFVGGHGPPGSAIPAHFTPYDFHQFALTGQGTRN